MSIRATITDKEALGKINPEQVAMYLKNKGWIKQKETWREASIWKNGPDLEYEILVPPHSDFADYARRMADSLMVLSVFEDRSQLDIYEEIIGVKLDVSSSEDVYSRWHKISSGWM